jgi:hypothetical protein
VPDVLKGVVTAPVIVTQNIATILPVTTSSHPAQHEGDPRESRRRDEELRKAKRAKRGRGRPLEKRFRLESTVKAVSDGALPIIAKRVARKIMALMIKWFPGEVVCRHSVSRLALEAYKITDDDYGEKEANEWASGFELEPDLGARDGDLL